MSYENAYQGYSENRLDEERFIAALQQDCPRRLFLFKGRNTGNNWSGQPSYLSAAYVDVHGKANYWEVHFKPTEHTHKVIETYEKWVRVREVAASLPCKTMQGRITHLARHIILIHAPWDRAGAERAHQDWLDQASQLPLTDSELELNLSSVPITPGQERRYSLITARHTRKDGMSIEHQRAFDVAYEDFENVPTYPSQLEPFKDHLLKKAQALARLPLKDPTDILIRAKERERYAQENLNPLF